MQEQNKVKISRYAKIMSLMANLQKLKTRALKWLMFMMSAIQANSCKPVFF